MSSKSKKEAKTASSGRGDVAQSSRAGAAAPEKKKGPKKFNISLPGRKKSKDGENLLPDKDIRKTEGGGGSRGKGQAEPTVPENVPDLEDSPGHGRRGLPQTQTTPVKTPPEGQFYPPGALKQLSGTPVDVANSGEFTSMGVFDKLEAPQPIAQVSR